MKVLIAEDDPNIRAGIVEILEDEGYTPIEASDGQEALDKFRKSTPDFVILDIMMPHINGYDVCKAIRVENDNLPIVFLSAKTEEIDKVLGLELGADDYISKPFGVKEFLARIRAVSRRSLRNKAQRGDISLDSFQMNDLEIIPGELRAKRGDKVIELSPRDIQVLQLLYRHPDQALDRNTIFNECWGIDYYPNSRTLDQHISQLRKKIEHDPKSPTIIRTIHGVGYRFELT